MNIKTIKRYTFEHRPLHFGESSETDFEFLSILTIHDDRGNIVEETKYFPNGTAEEVNRFTYNSDSKLVEHTMEMVSEGMRDVVRFERDAAGRLVKEQKFYGDDPGEAISYTYNADGQVSEVLKTDADGEFESRESYEYNDKAAIVLRTAFDDKGKTIEKSDMEYDSSGNLSRRTDYDAQGQVVSTSEYTYDKKNAIQSVIQKNAQGKLKESVKYTYDDHGNVVEKAIRDFHPRTFRFSFNEKDECTEEATYDQHGQITSKRVFEFDDGGHLVREITYHMDANRGELNKGHRYEYEFYA